MQHMTNLILAELYKLKRNRSFWGITVIVTGVSLLLHYLVMIDWWIMDNTNFMQVGLGKLNALSPFITLLFFNLIVSTLAGFYIAVDFSPSSVIKNQVMSGNKRSHIFLAKFLVFSLGAVLITIFIPLIIGLLMVLLLGHGDILNNVGLLYLARSFGLFLLPFLSYIALIMLFAVVTEDSGKTIIFSILFTIVIFVVEKLPMSSVIEFLYKYSIFQQFSDVFTPIMTKGQMLTALIVGTVSLIFIVFCGIFIFNRKEIK